MNDSLFKIISLSGFGESSIENTLSIAKSLGMYETAMEQYNSLSTEQKMVLLAETSDVLIQVKDAIQLEINLVASAASTKH